MRHEASGWHLSIDYCICGGEPGAHDEYGVGVLVEDAGLHGHLQLGQGVQHEGQLLPSHTEPVGGVGLSCK